MDDLRGRGGQDSPVYRVVLPFASWGERSSWPHPRAMAVEAFGEAEAGRVWDLLGESVASTEIRIWEALPDASSNVADTPEMASLYSVMVREVSIDRVSEFRELQKKFKKAYEAADSKPVVRRFVLRFGDGQGHTFLRSQAFDGWSDMDAFNPNETLSQHFGEEGWALLRDELDSMWVSRQSFISAYRPDLSRPPEGAATDQN